MENTKEILNQNISVLELPKEVEFALKKTYNTNLNSHLYGENIYIKTIGDLIGLSYEKARDIVYLASKNNFENNFYTLNEKLYLYGLKLKNSEFSVYDLKINNLDLEISTIKKFVKAGVVTIGDFYLRSSSSLIKIHGLNVSEIKEFRAAIALINSEKKTKHSNEDKKPKKEFVDTTKLSREEILELDVSKVDFGGQVNSFFSRMYAEYKIGNIVNLTEEELLNFNRFGEGTVEIIKNRLAEIGLELKPQIKTQDNLLRVAVFTKKALLGKTKEEILNLNLNEYVYSLKLKQVLKKCPELQTIGDLVEKLSTMNIEERIYFMESFDLYRALYNALCRNGVTIPKAPRRTKSEVLGSSIIASNAAGIASNRQAVKAHHNGFISSISFPIRFKPYHENKNMLNETEINEREF